ncbi:MAG: hypothetical protein JO022_11010 [Acidobacteriaceae bacterium]|nr:hypothetical protein [Acidobacteriaceae bacterium]
MAAPLRGSFWVFVQYDVCDEIRLEELRPLIGAEPATRQPSFKHPAPDYVRFQREPVVQNLDPVTLPSGEQFRRRLKYFDYGVISVELELRFEADWDELVRISSRWITAPEIETRTRELVRAHVAQFHQVLEDPYNDWLSEDYYVIQISQPLDETAPDLLAHHGDQLAQIVRGELSPLSASEQRDALQATLSYYPRDLLVVGWLAAIIYDTPQGAAPAIQLLEYANTQLLEFRHYDDVLTRVLADVYKYLEQRKGLFRRWRIARRAEALNTILLDIRELTERMDNAIKFLSDMFYARAYKVAADRIGVTDYRNLVEAKLRTASTLYQGMVEEFHQSRAFLLEVMVVAILVIELVNVFVRH